MVQQEKEGLPYLPISPEKILKVLEGKSEEELNSLNITPGLRLMFKLRYATQLRKNVYDKLSGNLKIDISPDGLPLKDESLPK